MYRAKLREKWQEALKAVLPIVAIVLLLSVTLAPMPASILLAFLAGALLLLVGMMFFTLGAELAMEPMGERLGARITRTKKLGIILPLGFLLGFMITISEPDLQVLANQVQSIPNKVLILAVAAGVGLFLVVALLRMLFSIPLPPLLVGFYAVVFLLAALAPKDFLAVAFDSGGVASGPMTATFLLPLATGACSAVGGNIITDAFGVVAMVAMTPLITIQILGLVYQLRAKRAPAAAAPAPDPLAHLDNYDIIPL